MSLSLVGVENKKQNGDRSDLFGLLSPEVFGDVLSYLEPQDLVCSIKVCRAWKCHVEAECQWKTQCQILLDLPSQTDPKSYVPGLSSYKAIFRQVYASILGEHVYSRYIGTIESVPRIPKSISLQRWNEPDPCNPALDLTKPFWKPGTIGEKYVWVYIPSDIIITDSKGVFALSKEDDPNDTEAPELLLKEEGLEESVSKPIEFGTQSVLKVPVTINNIKVLFKYPKEGKPLIFEVEEDQIIKQLGNKRWPAGWFCMRNEVFAKGGRFVNQDEIVSCRRVVHSELLPRILFNCLKHVRTGEVNIYPDDENLMTYARTSTRITRSELDNSRPVICGYSSPDVLRVAIYFPHFVDDLSVGVAVELPKEVRAIDL